MIFTIDDKRLIINFSRGRQPIKRLCIASTYTYVYDEAKRDVSIKQKMM
jgi:hypothetical protein